MTIKELKHLLETEDRLEFKEAKTQYAYNSGRKSILGYVSALSNEGGGYLVLGVRETAPHEICGSLAFEGREDKLKQDVYRDLKIRIRTQTLYEKANRVLVIEIPSRPIGKALCFDNIPLMRVGENLARMSDEIYLSIIQEQEPDFSATICKGLAFEDLDTEAIAVMKERYATKQGNPTFRTLPDIQALTDLELIKNGKFNYAALLLLGTRKALQKYLPNSSVTVEYRSTHSMIPYTARQEFQEPLFTAIDKIWAYINQPARNPLLHFQHKFNNYDIKSFNETVVREAIINACAHRSYAFPDDVFIKHYPDELIITNAGGFPTGVTLDNTLTVNSKPRNKLIMDVLKKTGEVDCSEQSVDKMFYICLMEGKPLPDYSQTDDYQVDLCLKTKIVDEAFYLFVNEIQRRRKDKLNVFDLLTLNKVRQNISTDLPKASVEKLQREGLIKPSQPESTEFILCDLYYDLRKQSGHVNSSVNSRYLEKTILEIIQYNDNINVKRISVLTNISNRTVARHLAKLKEKNLIEFRGVPKTGGYYLKNRQ
jgi:ATP-dependent DNA helicase RecG